LLLPLAAALAGLLLLLDRVASLTSAAPPDLLAAASSAEGSFGIPNGVGLVEFLVFTVSIALAAAVLSAALGWPSRRTPIRRSWPLVLAALGAASLVASGAYLALSGILGGSIPYDEHFVFPADLNSESLILLAAFFLSATIAGLLNWRLLAASLLVWLAAGGFFGYLDSRSVDGLLLFPRADPSGVPGDFGAAVRGLQGNSAELAGEPAESAPLLSETTALQDLPRGDAPVFRVAGASNTRYLRTSTGEIYRDGAWRQLDRPRVLLKGNEPVAEALAPLAEDLHLPTATPLHESTDQIRVTPVEGVADLPAGALPLARNLRSVSAPLTYFPFSETLESGSELPDYETSSARPVFGLNQKVSAATVMDAAYLQLPEGLSPRLYELADRLGGEESPYLRARLIQIYLQEEYAFERASTAGEAQPPLGQDPVEWFLFERRAGTSGNFSSAFVVLARAAGVPARVVSGWVIATQEEAQTVRRSQAHQWAEIALTGLGWVTVDPFPRDAFSDADVDHAWASVLDELAASAETELRDAVAAVRRNPDDPEDMLRLFAAIDGAWNQESRRAAQTTVAALSLDRFTGMLLGHEDARSRAVAAFGLEVIADPESLDALLLALANDVDGGVRASAASALPAVGSAGDEEKAGAVQGLLSALSGDVDAAVRAAAATALGALKADGASGAMLSAFDSDSSPEVRAAVARALGEIGDAAFLLPLLDARAGDASAEVRFAAAEALAGWEFAALLEILESAAEPVLRAAAVQLMGEGRFAEAVIPLGAALSDAAGQVRAAARTALEAIGEVIWLESGGGVLVFMGDLAFLPYVTAENHAIAPPSPVFRVRGSAHTSLLRVAVGDFYERGEWFPAEQVALPAGVAGIGFRPEDIRPVQTSGTGNLDSIYLSGIGLVQAILSGPTPTSLHAESFSIPVSYRVPSHTVVARGPARYGWDATVYDYSPQLLDAADTRDGFEYLQLPEGAWVERLRALATAITAGHSTPYQKAKAIERHLIEEYAYQSAGPAGDSVPPGQDPVAHFLFESREGTCGAFSSAFVLLARSVGIPARVVSGWAVAETAASQIVFNNQAHQWAEVPFDGLGWVTFDPTPEGAPSRVPEDEIEAFERLGAEVIRLEPGGALVKLDGETFISPGTTARPAEAAPREPLFEVLGAENTGYLRLAAGDRYDDGSWQQLEPREIPYTAGSDIPGQMRELYDELSGLGDAAISGSLGSPSLFGAEQNPLRSASDSIQLLPAEGFDGLPHGGIPAPFGAQRVDTDGVVRPFSATFTSETAGPAYTWTAKVSFFSRGRYESAAAIASATTYTQLPAGLPDHVRQLARQITAGHDSVFAQAEALEQYLRGNYNYASAASNPEIALPVGRDPVEWFLFEARQGTSGQFSSAFAVLARSVGIPARVVSGFVISPMVGQQAVYADQAHQWAEIALEGVGWVRFDPTPTVGAPSRAAGTPPEPRVLEGGDDGGDVAGSPVDTITDITESPSEIRRLTPFVVSGTVLTADGAAVSGVAVEIYINETKEHGGTKIGETSSRSGRFRAVAQLPPAMELGDYQLLARAVGNSLFNESWSDPDIQVFSGNKIELTGPVEVELNAEAAFDGTVTDDSERGVVGREIEVRFDGRTAHSLMTDQAGRFSFARSFSQLGEHWVEVELAGEELLLDNTARLNFNVVLGTELAVYAPDSVARGEGFLVTGELHEAGGSPFEEGAVELSIEGPTGAVAAVTVEVREDGSFEHAIPSLDRTGDYTLTGHFAGEEFVRPAAAETAIRVLRPTTVTIDGPAAVRSGERFPIAGTLLEGGGRPVANAELRVLGGEPLALVTDAEGRFAGQLQATFDELAAHGAHESTLRIEAVFDGTADLAASDAALNVKVGAPWILVETPGPVTRGGEVVLRGAVLLGEATPIPDVELTAGDGATFRTSNAGNFVQAFPIAADTPLGATDLVVRVPTLGLEAAVSLNVRSGTTLILTPVSRLNPGGKTMLQAALLDDSGIGIAGAVLRTGQGLGATTDESGIATLELEVPELESLRGSRVDINYAGDDRHAPLSMSYYWEGAITPGGANWLLWAGIPILVVLVAAAGYAARRLALPPLRRKRSAVEPPASPARDEAAAEDPAEAVAEAVAEADDAGGEHHQPVELQISFQTVAEDLADVWGPGEEVQISVRVTVEGQARAGAVVETSVGDDVPSRLTLGEDGAGGFTWNATIPGEFAVSAQFMDGDMVFSESRSLRIVEFREEIVRLYGAFQEWAVEQDVGVEDSSTPREAAALLVAGGLPLPGRSLSEIIARFEEADYSEHAISRRHYEAMYRALVAVAGAGR
jgi:transglutaminase-like putative cysteine protease/HEAT repeat protein